MENDSLDSILSGRETASEQTQEAVTQTAQPETQEQPEASTQESEPQARTVPHEALHAEKQKVKRYTEEVSSLRQEMSERDAAWERRISQLIEAQKPKAAAIDPIEAFFQDPNKAAQSAVSPQFEQLQQTLLAVAKDSAITRYDEQVVEDAEQAFIQAMQGNRLDPSDYQKVVSSPNRYAAAVQWHKRQQAQAEIGDDPAAFRAKLEAEILAKHGLTPQGDQPQMRPAVMPSNLAGARNVGARNGPAWSGPPALNDIFSMKRPTG